MDHSGQEAAGERLVASPRPPPEAGVVLGAATLLLVAAGVAASRVLALSPAALGLAALLWAVICLAVLVGRRAHPYRRFGAANTVTTVRAMVTVPIAALAVQGDAIANAAAGTAPASVLLWGATIAAVASLVLDGVDGPLARAAGLESAFGARYDMETDALLAFVLAALIWRTGELGPWVLALGTMRYLFVAGAWLVPALNAPLFPSFRRKLICVVQIGALCAIVAPAVDPPLSVAIGAVAVLALGYSFARDTTWLLRHERRDG